MCRPARQRRRRSHRRGGLLRITLKPFGGRLPEATLWTIIGSVGAFIAFAFADAPPLIQELVPLSGAALRQGAIWTLITSLVLHMDVRDLLMNGLMLWWFGSPLERLWGKRAYLRFILMVGVLANVGAGVAAFAGAGGYAGGLRAPVSGLVLAWGLTYGNMKLQIFTALMRARTLAYVMIGIGALSTLLSGSILLMAQLAAGLGAAWWLESGPGGGQFLRDLMSRRRASKLRILDGGSRRDDRPN